MPIAEIGTGRSDRLTKIGTIAPVINGTSQRFPIRSLSALKCIMLHLQGAVDVTDATDAAVDPYGPVKFIKGVRVLVSGQPGPYLVSGMGLYGKNLKDDSRAPYLGVPADATVADNKAFEAALFMAFNFPHFEDEDASLLKTKVDKTYEIEVDFGDSSSIITGGAHHMATAGGTVLDVIAHEIDGLEPTKNIYNKNYERRVALAVNSQLRIPLDLSSGFLNELQFQAYTAAGALSDTVIESLTLRNGAKYVFRDLPWKALKRWTEQKNPSFVPATIPTGFNFIDLTTNNAWKSMRNTAEYKELELILNVKAAGELNILLNLATEPVAGD